MADILIRGMEMPKTCADCYDVGLPTAIAFLGTKCPRATGCPLHELPPHGDLIDRNATIEESEKPTIFDLTDVSDFLHEQPVVIPSNKENKNAN